MQTIFAPARIAPTRRFAASAIAHFVGRLSFADEEKEAARLGLPQSGNKATLITRIQHAAKRTENATVVRLDGSIRRRLATTATPSSRHPRPTLDVKLPDLSPPQDTEEPHIPFLPDFWDSSSARARDAIHQSPAVDSPMPKVLIVADTQASSPSFSISQHTEVDENSVASDSTKPKPGLLRDIAEDLGLPRASDISAATAYARDAVLTMAQNTQVQGHRPSSSSRPLDSDEARGLWIFLGILGGSWLAGGILTPSPKRSSNAL